MRKGKPLLVDPRSGATIYFMGRRDRWYIIHKDYPHRSREAFVLTKREYKHLLERIAGVVDWLEKVQSTPLSK